MSKKLQQEFDAFAAVYDEITVDELQYDAHERIPQELLRVNTPETATVLDLGCGTGLSAAAFFEKNYQVHGIDISPEMLKQAKRYPFASLKCADLESDKRDYKEQFDFISCVGVMEFIQNPEAFLTKCRENLKDNGLLGITFPLNTYSEAEVPVFSYDPDQALRLLQSAGLQPKQMVLFTGYFMPEEDINYLGVIASC